MYASGPNPFNFFFIGQDDIKKTPTLFLSEKDSIAKLHILEAQEHLT